MKKLSLLLVAIILFSYNITNAQVDILVTGKVIDKDINLPLEYATIAFFSLKENRIVTGGISDINGSFKIPVPSGTYNIIVEYISYSKITIPNRALNSDTDLGVLEMKVDNQTLNEVSIIAERTTVELKLDKKVYTVGKDLTVRGGTVSDVLDNIPSVSVDADGIVALRGNDNVTILINGKPSGLVGLNSTDALRQLPAESIERVEVITSPSARYDASGTAGILNIILRRSKLQGINGAITTNVGYPTTAGISGNLNYRSGNFNFFNTSGYSYRESPGNTLTETEYFNADEPNTFFNEKRKFDRQNLDLTTNFGVEWYINDTANLTFSIVYRDSDEESNNTNTIDQINADGNLISRLFRFEEQEEDDNTIQYALNFDKQFGDDSQHKFTFDFQYETNDENEKSLILDSIKERVQTIDSQNQILLQSDYVLPIGDDSQFEVGFRGDFIEQNTDFTLEFEDELEFVIDTDVSNNLIFKQQVNAFYSQYGSKIKSKFSYLLGLRMESTRITIEQVTSTDFDKKNYVDLFPTANLSYEISDTQSLQLGYNRRISRPRSRFLNPFPSRSSATNLFQGNPDIDPSYSNQVDLGYLNTFGKITLNSSIYFSKETDVFTFISEDTGDTVIVGETEVPVIRRGPINLATNDRYGFEFTLTYKPNKKWNLNGNFNLFQSITKGFYDGTDFGAENLSWFARINNKYTLPGNIDWQTRIVYTGPSEDAQNKRKGILSADLAFSKDLFKDQASIAFNISDLLNSRKRITDSFTPTFNSYVEFQQRERSFNLSFTYRFNQQRKQQGGERGEGRSEFDFEG